MVDDRRNTGAGPTSDETLMLRPSDSNISTQTEDSSSFTAFIWSTVIGSCTAEMDSKDLSFPSVSSPLVDGTKFLQYDDEKYRDGDDELHSPQVDGKDNISGITATAAAATTTTTSQQPSRAKNATTTITMTADPTLKSLTSTYYETVTTFLKLTVNQEKAKQMIDEAIEISGTSSIMEVEEGKQEEDIAEGMAEKKVKVSSSNDVDAAHSVNAYFDDNKQNGNNKKENCECSVGCTVM
jgi:hypothetical protein